MSERLGSPENDRERPITIQQLAEYRMVQIGLYPADSLPGSFSGADYYEVGLGIMGGCEVCSASIAAYNACPTTTGYWRCEGCTDDMGYTSVEQANEDIFGE